MSRAEAIPRGDPGPDGRLVVRDSTEADLASIQAIYGHHVLHGLATFEETPPSVVTLRGRRAEVLARGVPYLVAERDGAVVGYSYASPYRTRPAYRYSLENSVYVREDLAGQGIGRALLSALVARCGQGPWRRMVAVIGDTANVASIRLHERLGFRHVGTLHAVGFKHGRWVDTVLMERALGAGDAMLPADVPAGRQRG